MRPLLQLILRSGPQQFAAGPLVFVLATLGVTAWGQPIPLSSDELAVNPAIVGQSDSELTQQLTDVVLTDLQRHRYGSAVARLQSLSETFPDDRRIWYLLAVGQRGLGKNSESLRAAKQCVQIAPEWQAGYWLYAAVATRGGRSNQAKKAYDRAVEIAPQEPAGYLQRGRYGALYGTDEGQLRSAIADLKQAEELGTPTELTHGLLGLAHKKLGEANLAEPHFLAAIAADPTNLAAIKELVALYDARNKTDEADRLLRQAGKALAADSKQRKTMSELAFYEAGRGIKSGAAASLIAAHFHDAIVGQPDRVDLRLQFAQWLDATNRNADAVSMLREGLRNSPDNPQLAGQLAWALAESNDDLQQAWALYQQAIDGDPDNPYLADTGAWIEFLNARYDRALELIQPSLPLADRVPEIAYHAGAIYARLGRQSEAKRYLRLATQSPHPFARRDAARQLLEELSPPAKR